MLVLPNGWVKVAAALPRVCADLLGDTLEQAGEPTAARGGTMRC
jgi:hypothetical protein